jgi:hypothetical protein
MHPFKIAGKKYCPQAFLNDLPLTERISTPIKILLEVVKRSHGKFKPKFKTHRNQKDKYSFEE